MLCQMYNWTSTLSLTPSLITLLTVVFSITRGDSSKYAAKSKLFCTNAHWSIYLLLCLYIFCGLSPQMCCYHDTIVTKILLYLCALSQSECLCVCVSLLKCDFDSQLYEIFLFVCVCVFVCVSFSILYRILLYCAISMQEICKEYYCTLDRFSKLY